MYELAHLAIYLVAALITAVLTSYRALLVFFVVAAVAGAAAGPAALAWRASLPGRGGWDALGDALLAVMLAGSVAVLLLLHALRIRLQRRGWTLATILQLGAVLIAPAIAIGGMILLAELG